jgi:hypothetical protein
MSSSNIEETRFIVIRSENGEDCSFLTDKKGTELDDQVRLYCDRTDTVLTEVPIESALQTGDMQVTYNVLKEMGELERSDGAGLPVLARVFDLAWKARKEFEDRLQKKAEV